MFENATLLTRDWLRNEIAFELDGTEIFTTEICREYYLSTCALIKRCHYLKLSPTNIETFITAGEYTYTEESGKEHTITSEITVLADRQYLFKRAQAKQLVFDRYNGRSVMMRDTMRGGGVCPDTVAILKQLGLYKPSELID